MHLRLELGEERGERERADHVGAQRDALHDGHLAVEARVIVDEAVVAAVAVVAIVAVVAMIAVAMIAVAVIAVAVIAVAVAVAVWGHLGVVVDEADHRDDDSRAHAQLEPQSTDREEGDQDHTVLGAVHL